MEEVIIRPSNYKEPQGMKHRNKNGQQETTVSAVWKLRHRVEGRGMENHPTLILQSCGHKTAL